MGGQNKPTVQVALGVALWDLALALSDFVLTILRPRLQTFKIDVAFNIPVHELDRGVIEQVHRSVTVDKGDRSFRRRGGNLKLAESLSGVKSLLCHPANMTHKSIPVDKRRAAGVADSLIRLSVGLEEAEYLVQDLDQAFAAVKQTQSTTLNEIA